MAYVKLTLDWDWSGAGREFQQALALNPNSAMAHDEYAFYLFMVGRFEEAIEQQQRALRLDPLSLLLNSDLAQVYYMARKFDLAIEQARKTIALDPHFPQSHVFLVLALAQQGQFPAALAALHEARKLDNNPWCVGALGSAAAMAGERKLALEALNDLKARGTQVNGCVEGLAAVYAALGEKDEAFLWLQKAFEERSELMTILKVDPSLDNLRSDPRFKEMLRKVGLGE